MQEIDCLTEKVRSLWQEGEKKKKNENNKKKKKTTEGLEL